MFYQIILLVLAAVIPNILLVTGQNVQLPPNILICKRSDPLRDDCIKRTINSLLPALKNGFSPLGLKPIDPYFVEKADLTIVTADINLVAGGRNATASGLSKGDVKRIRSKIGSDSMLLEVEVYFPKLIIQAKYKGVGSYGDLQLNARGDITIGMYNVTAIWRMKASAVTEPSNGLTYMKPVGIELKKPKIDRMRLKISGLFPDRDLNKFVEELFNQQWVPVYDQVFPFTKQIWEPIFLDILSAFFNNVPFDTLMPK